MEERFFTDPAEFTPLIDEIATAASRPSRFRGLCGFDGFIDRFVRMQSPPDMGAFGQLAKDSAGVSASAGVRVEGERFGGNGPLLVNALHGLFGGGIDLTYAGALGYPDVHPLFANALAHKVALKTLAAPATSDCLEFTDGKIMLSDMTTCADVHSLRLQEAFAPGELETLLSQADFVAAVNWGKLPALNSILELLLERLATGEAEQVPTKLFVDLAEFAHRSEEERRGLIELIGKLATVTDLTLSLNLREAWQLAATCGWDFSGQKEPAQIVTAARFLFGQVSVGRLVIHPNNGAAMVSTEGASWVTGPFCRAPLISTGAGDHFGAGVLAGQLLGLGDAASLLLGNAASGYFVRSGHCPPVATLAEFLRNWARNILPERLPAAG